MIILQKLKVRDVCNNDISDALLCGPDDDITTVIERFAGDPALRGIFVTDTEQRLLGVITRRDLLEWARIKVGDIIRRSPNVEDTVRLVSLMSASTAGKFMKPESRKAIVHLEDSLVSALRLMLDLDMIVLPVVDDNKRITGDLRLTQLLARIVQESRKNK